MSSIRTSVVVSSYNYERFIGRAIESVLSQTRTPDEVIVVDDGSTDGSVKLIGSFGNSVNLVVQENKGVCVARNNGAKIAAGDVIAFMDSDDIWRPEKIELQVSALEADPEVGLVSCGIRFFDEADETIVVYDEGKSGWCANDILLYAEPVLNTTASAIMVRKSVFDSIGGFDERRELFSAEDREFCYRAAKISKLAFIPEVLVDYRIHGSNGHLNITRMDRAMRAAYQKIFSAADDATLTLKRRSYGNLFTNLAGSHFRAGNYSDFLLNAAKALALTPGNLGQFARYPLRQFKRRGN